MSALTTSVLSHGFFLPTEGVVNYPAPGDVRLGVDTGDGTPGTLVLPPADKVLKDTGYGAGGTEYTGTLQLQVYTPPPKPAPPVQRVVCPPPPCPPPTPRWTPPICAPLPSQNCGQWFVADHTHTEFCPAGTVGQKSTVHVQETSTISYADAKAKAKRRAIAEAKAGLVCVYSSTKTVSQTASCPAGMVGEPKTVEVTVTKTSPVSQAEADALAIAEATQQAMAQAVELLECEEEPVEYTSTQSFTASCEEGLFGDPVTRERTATSMVSQEDADAQALALAQADAEAALVCYPFSFTATETVSCSDDSFSTATATGYGPDALAAEIDAVNKARALAYASCPV